MAKLEFKSPKDGSILSFSVTQRKADEISFDVGVRTPWFSGTAPASSYIVGSPSMMFREIEANWTGWEGTKNWEDLDHRVSFAATSDSTGHINLGINLTGPQYDSKLCAVLMYDAG